MRSECNPEMYATGNVKTNKKNPVIANEQNRFIMDFSHTLEQGR